MCLDPLILFLRTVCEQEEMFKLPMKMELTGYSGTLAQTIQTPGDHPK